MNESENFLPPIADGEDKSSPFKNRLRKNYKHIRKWAKRTQTNCFRLFERDVKGYPLAIDFYAGRFCVHYFAPNKDQEDPPAPLKTETEEALQTIFGAPLESIYWRTRVKRDKMQQYEKRDYSRAFFTVMEYGVKFLVNLLDYLDTGLFLDHRETRHYVAGVAQGKRVLNLFAYTCSFSVHAAMGGASFTKSVDLSNTYTDWGRENFIINNLSLKNNEIIRDDCLKFLDDEVKAKEVYDIIIIDPPTISRSKKMDQSFNIQIDYISLLNSALKLLSKDGILFFSTNSRKFSMDPSLFEAYQVRNITDKTIPFDFHNQKIHKCWKITSNSR